MEKFEIGDEVEILSDQNVIMLFRIGVIRDISPIKFSTTYHIQFGDYFYYFAPGTFKLTEKCAAMKKFNKDFIKKLEEK